MKRERLLIGSCGGLTGIYLARQFKRFPELEIWGADTSENNAGKFFVEHFVEIPRADHPRFTEVLIEILREYDIKYYVPTHSLEISKVAENEEIIRARTAAKFMITPIETHHLLNDKMNANRYMKQWGIPVPKMYELGDEPQYPVFMKRKTGSGSHGVMLIERPEVYHVLKKYLQDAVFFEWIQGTEYTVDCMFDPNGVLLAYNQRVRVKTIGGAVSITQNRNEIDIEPWLQQLAKKVTFRGCVNFQYILREQIPYFIDINLRFPSGGLPLSVASGMDVPAMLLRMLRGEEIVSGEYSVNRSSRVMYRYFEEIFEENDSV